MTRKLIEFKDNKEEIWLKFAADCKIKKVIMGEKIIDLIENYFKKGGKEKWLNKKN